MSNKPTQAIDYFFTELVLHVLAAALIGTSVKELWVNGTFNPLVITGAISISLLARKSDEPQKLDRVIHSIGRQLLNLEAKPAMFDEMNEPVEQKEDFGK